MRPPLRAAAAALLAGAVTLGVAALSRVPYAPPGGDDAVLRLSWRTRGERVRECRRLTAQELAALPVHMRREEVCEGRVLPYVLRVEVDGRAVVHDTVRAAGAREDRPLYVYRELRVPPGPLRLSVRFTREDAPAGAPRAAGELRRAASPARLELSEALHLRPGEVALVTYDADRRALVARTSAATHPPPQTARESSP